MKIKNGFVVREIAGQCIVVALGEASKSFNGMIRLNETGKFIWSMLEKGAEINDIVDAVVEEYDAKLETVRSDVERFVSTLNSAGILE